MHWTFIYLFMATKKTTTKADSKKTATKSKVEQKITQPVQTVNNSSTDDEQLYDDLPAIPELNMKERQRRKTGGRQKGSVNKVTAMTKAVISDLLSDYQDSGLMGSDFLALEPKDRFQCAEKMMQYIMPKMQSTSVDFNNKATKITIEQQLRELAKDPEETDNKKV